MTDEALTSRVVGASHRSLYYVNASFMGIYMKGAVIGAGITGMSSAFTLSLAMM